jgi:hypothetical protein
MSELNKRFPIYSKLIKLYPVVYQKEYGDAILQTTADMLDNLPNSVVRIGVWISIFYDLMLNIIRQQLILGGVMKLIKLLAIVVNALFILWLLYNAIDSGFKGTLPQKVSSMILIVLLITNCYFLSRAPKTSMKNTK